VSSNVPGPRGGSVFRGVRAIAIIALVTAGSGAFLGHAPSIRAAGPNPPTLVQAQGLSGTTVELLWTAVPGATGYKVYRDGSSTALASPTGTRLSDSVAALSTHTYRVTAIAGTESAMSAPATATAQAAPDASPPTTPGAITTSSLGSSSVKLSWGSSSDNVGIEGYRILRGLTSSSLSDIYTTDAVANYTATNLRAGTTYWFGVQALDAANNVSSVRTISVTTKASTDATKPSAPSSLTTSVFSSARIDMYWSASSSSDISGYQVLRNGTVIGRVDPPNRMTFSDTGLSPSTSYSYAIQAIDSAGNVSSSGPIRPAATLAPSTVIVARGPYVQWVTGTSARIAWWTNLQTPALVSCPACPQTTSSDPTLAYEHVMLLAGLSPGTTYAYAVGDGHVTASGTFSTAIAPGTSFSFAAIGDFGGGSAGESGNGSRISVDGTSFIQTLGDNIYPEAADPSFVTRYSDYDARFFRQFRSALAKKAFWAANGNKEYYGNGAWFAHMWLPNNEQWYSYDWGDAHILVLDTEQPYAPGTPQYAFAQADLSAHQGARWRIVALQRPAYSSGSANSSSVPVRTYLVPLFEAQNVQLVLSGNSHNYERTFPLLSNGDPNNPVVSSGGVTYVVSGNGGNGFNPFTIAEPYWSAFRQSGTYGYVQVTVSPSSLVLKELSSAGTLLDSATIGSSLPPGAISGTVTDAVTHAGVANATVSYSGGSTITASDGSYSLSGVAPGTYSVTASAPGYSGSTNASVTVTSGTTTTSNFALAPLGAISGTVTDASTNNPIGGATVKDGTKSTTTATDGTYSLSNEAPGTYSVTASAVGYSASTNTGVAVTSGATTTSNFALTPTAPPGAIGGTVTDSNSSTPISGATVSYSGGNETATTATDGSYTLSNIAPGTYSVTASAAGHSPATNTGVSVTSGASTTSNFALAPSSGVIFGDGFESGNLSQWTTSGGLTVESTTVHIGGFAAEGNTTVGATYAKKLLPSTYVSGYFRAYVYVASAASQVNLLRFRTAADGSLGYVYVTAAGKLGLRDDVSAQTLSSATSMSFGTWHSLEVHFTIGTSGSTEIWLDSNPVADLGQAVNLGTTNIGKVQIGEVITGRTYDLIFDDVAFNTSRIGP
jgi:chitodextrinase